MDAWRKRSKEDRVLIVILGIGILLTSIAIVMVATAALQGKKSTPPFLSPEQTQRLLDDYGRSVDANRILAENLRK